ncbi:MAG: ROK family protein [Dehalococcoidia bacterium]
MEEFYIVAVDLGGTSYRVALADSQAKILNRKAEPTRSHEGWESGLERIKSTIQETASPVDFGLVKAISVSAGGPLNPQTGTLLTPPSLPTWKNVPLKTILETAFDKPVFVENDADLAALGEHRFGAGRGYDRLIYITVSTGIGGGIILGGEILRGKDISVAEIGHIVVDPDGPFCNCGGKGHVEALASGTAIARIAARRVRENGSAAILKQCSNDLSMLKAEMVVEAARGGDHIANVVIEEAGRYLGIAVTSLIHILDPQMVIIGGGVSNAGGLILEPIRRAIEEHAMVDFRERAGIVRSELGDDSGLMGAIALALDNLKQDHYPPATATDGQ